MLGALVRYLDGYRNARVTGVSVLGDQGLDACARAALSLRGLDSETVSRQRARLRLRRTQCPAHEEEAE